MSKRWTIEEVELLENLYPYFGSEETERILDKLGIKKKQKAILDKAHLAGIAYKKGGSSAFLKKADKDIIKRVKPYLVIKGTKSYPIESNVEPEDTWNANALQYLNEIFPFFGIKKTQYLLSKMDIDKTTTEIITKADEIGIIYGGGGADAFIENANKDIIEKFRPYIYDVNIDPENDKQIVIHKSKIIKVASERYRELLDIIQNMTPRPKYTPPDEENTASLIIQLSDLHAGACEIVQNGDVVYNTDMMLEQLSRFTDKIQRIAEIHSRGDGKINEFVLALGGDMVEGQMIYKGQETQVDLHVNGQFEAATVGILNLIDTLKTNFGFPIRIFTVPGNHGRSLTGTLESNIDNNVYIGIDICLKRSLIENPSKYSDIDLNMSKTERNNFIVKGHKFTMVHAGPAQAMTPTGRAGLAAEFINGDNSEVLLCSHVHQASWTQFGKKHMFTNGTIKTHDEFAIKIRRPISYGVQNVFGVTEHRVPTFIYPIFVYPKDKRENPTIPIFEYPTNRIEE